jgi:signal transduction histidine kinase
VKHARASQVVLHLDQSPDEVTLEIRDNGMGSDTTASFPGHLGLQSMRERVAHLSGMFEIESLQGTGTRISVCLPASA